MNSKAWDSKHRWITTFSVLLLFSFWFFSWAGLRSSQLLSQQLTALSDILHLQLSDNHSNWIYEAVCLLIHNLSVWGGWTDKRWFRSKACTPEHLILSAPELWCACVWHCHEPKGWVAQDDGLTIALQEFWTA